MDLPSWLAAAEAASFPEEEPSPERGPEADETRHHEDSLEVPTTAPEMPEGIVGTFQIQPGGHIPSDFLANLLPESSASPEQGYTKRPSPQQHLQHLAQQQQQQQQQQHQQQQQQHHQQQQQQRHQPGVHPHLHQSATNLPPPLLAHGQAQVGREQSITGQGGHPIDFGGMGGFSSSLLQRLQQQSAATAAAAVTAARQQHLRLLQQAQGQQAKSRKREGKSGRQKGRRVPLHHQQHQQAQQTPQTSLQLSGQVHVKQEPSVDWESQTERKPMPGSGGMEVGPSPLLAGSSGEAGAAGGTTPSSSREGDKRKRQRLARKAELARQSRKRKKDRIGQLRKQVEMLKQAIEEEKHQQDLTKQCRFCVGRGASAEVTYVDMTSENAEIEKAIANMALHERAKFDAQVKAQLPSGTGLPEIQSSSSSATREENWDDLDLSSWGFEPEASSMQPQISQLLSQHQQSRPQLPYQPAQVGLTPGPASAVEFVTSIFRDANFRHKRAWAHLESLGDCVELCPPSRFLAWALGNESMKVRSEDPRGIWRRLWRDELRLDEDKIKQIDAMRSVCQRLRRKSIRLRQTMMVPIGQRLPPELRASTKTLRQMEPLPQLQTSHHLHQQDSAASLQELEIECLNRLRQILKPIEMIRFCVWADQNRLTIAALDLQ